MMGLREKKKSLCLLIIAASRERPLPEGFMLTQQLT